MHLHITVNVLFVFILPLICAVFCCWSLTPEFPSRGLILLSYPGLLQVNDPQCLVSVATAWPTGGSTFLLCCPRISWDLGCSRAPTAATAWRLSCWASTGRVPEPPSSRWVLVVPLLQQHITRLLRAGNVSQVCVSHKEIGDTDDNDNTLTHSQCHYPEFPVWLWGNFKFIISINKRLSLRNIRNSIEMNSSD